jgi:hypothetical protein
MKLHTLGLYFGSLVANSLVWETDETNLRFLSGCKQTIKNLSGDLARNWVSGRSAGGSQLRKSTLNAFKLVGKSLSNSAGKIDSLLNKTDAILTKSTEAVRKKSSGSGAEGTEYAPESMEELLGICELELIEEEKISFVELMSLTHVQLLKRDLMHIEKILNGLLKCPGSQVAKEALESLEKDLDYAKMDVLPLLVKQPPIDNRKAYKNFMKLKYETNERESAKIRSGNQKTSEDVEAMLDDIFADVDEEEGGGEVGSGKDDEMTYL